VIDIGSVRYRDGGYNCDRDCDGRVVTSIRTYDRVCAIMGVSVIVVVSVVVIVIWRVDYWQCNGEWLWLWMWVWVIVVMSVIGSVIGIAIVAGIVLATVSTR